MRVALMIEGQEGVTWEQWTALARACEEHGIEALFRSDHYVSFHRGGGNGSLDAWSTVTALAAATTTLRLGTLVSPATFRHPSAFAKAAVTADHVSGGRIELGLGAGWNEQEHASYGFPFHDMATRLEVFTEQLEIIHRQWTEERFDFAGRHYTLTDCVALPKPVQKPHPPIVVGGNAKAGTIRPAARFADEYNTIFCSPEEFAGRRERVRRICEEEGRDPDTLPVSLMLPVGVTEAGRRHLDDVPFRDIALIGTPAEVVERLHAYAEAGCARVMLQHLLHEDLETVAVIGEEIAPALA